MGIQFETRKETNKLVKWNIAIPRAGMKVKSIFFPVSDYKWYFVFESRIQSYFDEFQEIWNITLHCSDDDNNKKDPCFPLIVSIRYKGKDFFLSATGIKSKFTKIWSSSCSTFKKNYPSIEVAGTSLEFVFDFHLRTSDPGIFITEKSVQTSYTTVETKYPENHPCLKNLSDDLSKLIDDDTDTDVLVTCEDIFIRAHKMILGARSEVFRTMMQTDMVEGREGVIEISDMEPKILKIFIKYIYTGILPDLTVDTALPVYKAADKYQVEALKKRSGDLLVKNLSPENALAILVAADAHSDTDLKDQVVSYISEEKLPSRKEEWLKFCNEYPKLANEVFNFMFFK